MKTARGRALADRHRVAQNRITAETVQQMLRLWPLLVARGRVDANQATWLRATLAVVEEQRNKSAALAVPFLLAYRTVEGGDIEGFSPEPALTFNREQVTTSLLVTGPVAYQRRVASQLGIEQRDITPRLLEENRLPGGIQQKIAANVARAAGRHVLNGGRDTIDRVIAQDRRTVGYMRVTDGDPCWFCAMLASRGPVYEDESFESSDPRFHGPGDQKVHDSCGCLLVPMYSRIETEEEKAQLGQFKELEALWKKNNSRDAFKAAYEARKS